MRVDRNGNGTVFYDSAEMEVHALAPAPTVGSMSARRPTVASIASTPRGRRRRFSIRTTNTSGRSPSTARARSTPRRVTRASCIASRRTARATRVLHDQNHACLTLAFDRSGNCWSAPALRAACFGSMRRASGFLLLDTPYQESPRASIRRQGRDVRRAHRVDARARAIAAARSTPTEPSPPPAGANGVDRDHGDRHHRRARRPPQAASLAASSGDRRGPTGAVYRVLPDGLWDQLWESRDDAPYDVAIEPDGALLVATGGKGKIFRLAGESMRPTLVTRVSAQQAVMLHRAGESHVHRDVEPGPAACAVAGARRARHVRIRRQGCARRLDLGNDRVARHDAGETARRTANAIRQHADARRGVERLVGRLRRFDTARRSPARRRATCSGARCSPARASRRS